MKIDTESARQNDEYRQALAEWVKAHGLDPNDIPIDASAVVNRIRWTLTIEVFDRDDAGKIRHDGYAVFRRRVTVPLVSEPPEPPDVAV